METGKQQKVQEQKYIDEVAINDVLLKANGRNDFKTTVQLVSLN